MCPRDHEFVPSGQLWRVSKRALSTTTMRGRAKLWHSNVRVLGRNTLLFRLPRFLFLVSLLSKSISLPCIKQGYLALSPFFCSNLTSIHGVFSTIFLFFVKRTVRIRGKDANGLGGNPTDPQLIESICFTRTLDEWLIQKHQQHVVEYKDLGVEPRSMYFGSRHGSFRIYPARQSETCGDYDPTTRPWYVAGSSGPKSVVLILDTSGSMQTAGRMTLLKQAAKRIVSTLTISDRVLIVPFSNTANPITDPQGFMYRATDENKDLLAKIIDQLQAGGSTNFHSAFSQAFAALELSRQEEETANCNTAILFLTGRFQHRSYAGDFRDASHNFPPFSIPLLMCVDGENTDGPGVDEVSALVEERLSYFSEKMGRPPLLFTYSVSEESQVHVFPKQLACQVEFGLWSKIVDDADIVDSLSSYYQLFALGLGTERNRNFASWVQPYRFFTGNTMGTTISAPVYDRSQPVPLFLGVVGIDVPIAALDAALATDTTDSAEVRAESIKRIVDSSQANCPVELGLTQCELEEYRLLSAPDQEALCRIENCTGVQKVQEEACPTVSDYPQQVFVSSATVRATENPDYIEQVCCNTADHQENRELATLETCTVAAPTKKTDQGEGDSAKSNVGMIVGIVVGCVGFGLLVAAFIILRKRKTEEHHNTETGRPISHATVMVPPPPAWNPKYSESPAVKIATAPVAIVLPDEGSQNEE